MSNDKTEVIPTVAPVPTRRSILHPAASASAAHRERIATPPFADWRGQARTEKLPAASPDAGRPAPSRRERAARTAAGTTFPRVSTHRKPTAGREARRTAPTGTKGLRRQSRLRRHLRAALAGLLIAAALLTGLSGYALQGISSARQAALASAQHEAQAAPAPAPAPAWVTEDGGAAYDRTDPSASPLDLPRCTTSPDTPMPCLAHVSADSRRAVVLEEDASLTALVRR